MRARLLAACLVALLAAPLVAADQTRTLDGTYSAEFTGAATSLTSMSSGFNCLSVREAANGLTGTVTATWEAQSALVESLELAFGVFHGEERVYFRVSGPSPLTLTLTDVDIPQTDDPFPTALLGIHLVPTGAAVEQAVQLDVALTYASDRPLDPQPGACGF